MLVDRNEVAIFWDYGSCSVPSSLTGYIAVRNIRSLALRFGDIKSFKAYLSLSEYAPTDPDCPSPFLRSQMQSSGVSLTDVPGRKDIADKMLIVDILAYALDRPTASTVLVLIAADPSFAYSLSILRLRGYHVVVVAPPQTRVDLVVQASLCFDWNAEVFGGTEASSSFSSKARNRTSNSASSSGSTLSAGSSRTSSTSSPSQHSRFNGEVEGTLEGYLPTPAVPSTPATLRKEGLELEIPEAKSTIQETKGAGSHSGVHTTLISSGSLELTEEQVILDPLSSGAMHRVAHGFETSSVKSGDTIEDADHLSASSTASPAAVPQPSLDSTTKDSISTQTSMGGAKMFAEGVFQPLTQVLREARDEGMEHPVRSYLGAQLIEKDPQVYKRAGVTRFSEYITMAESSGVIETGGNDEAAWMKLTLPEIPTEFLPLAQVLREGRDEGLECIFRAYVGNKLAKKDSRLYQKAGATRFSQYITMAEALGIVETGGKDGTAWIKLHAGLLVAT